MSSAASSPSLSDLLSTAREYVSWEPRESHRAAVQGWMDSADEAKLKQHFYPRIAFGTAGLRSRMAPGYHHMNDLVILQTTQGFVRYIEETQGSDEAVKAKGVVIGYDGRHNSRRFAELASTVFLNAGFKVHLFGKMVATPFIPYAVLHMKAAAGIVVTASHNPKDDNGYKVYWNNGAQIIPPHDAGIAASIGRNLKPWHLKDDGSSELDLPFNPSHPNLSDPFDDMTSSYFQQASSLYCWSRGENKKLKTETCPVVYTAMHGVGAPFTTRAIEAFNLPPLIPTPQQQDANADFPTVAFPNPEEGKGALKLAMETADAHGANLILANDPDADRLAVAERTQTHGWQPLNGNEIALLLADWVWTNYVAQNNPTAEQKSNCCMVASTVSSGVLAAMARKEGFHFYDTLTGFKWMGNRASQAVASGQTFLFAYEVEIGFLVGSMSLDKDGVRTAAVFYELYSALRRQGLTCFDKLKQLYAKYGFFSMRTSYFFCDPTSGMMDKIFNRLRAWPQDDNESIPFNDKRYPASCGGVRVSSVRDVTFGLDTAQNDGRSLLPKDPSSHMITFRFENGCTATMRNSGTEPKLKYYVECSSLESKEAAQGLTEKMTQAIIDTFIQPNENQLQAPKTS